MFNFIKTYARPATLIYMISIVLINVAFSRLPIYQVWGLAISPMDPVAGSIYLFRDFAQRELGHRIFFAMMMGVGVSYLFASSTVAFASAAAFAAGELIDWLIFTFNRKPLSQRLLWSACLSSPVDSVVFLWGIHRCNLLAIVLMAISKWLGVLVIWMGFKFQAAQKTLVQNHRH